MQILANQKKYIQRGNCVKKLKLVLAQQQRKPGFFFKNGKILHYNDVNFQRNKIVINNICKF